MSKALIVTYSRFPDKGALAIRTFILAMMCRDLNCEVKVLCMGDHPYMESNSIDEIKYYSLRKTGGLWSRVKNYFGFKARIKKVIETSNLPDIIIMNSLPLNAMVYIKRLSLNNNIKLAVDCCEWYSKEQFRYRCFDIMYLLNSYLVRSYISDEVVGIAISKYLANYFKSKGCVAERIPVILDVMSASWRKTTIEERLVLLYAGSPGKKDYFCEIIEGLSMLDEDELQRIDFRLIGATKEFVLELLGDKKKLVDKLGTSLKCLGRVPREEVLSNLEEADFTVLMRSPVLRYAKAGFPTKVVESLASGTPVICNLTSDLGDYLTGGKDSIIVGNCSADAFCVAVRKALSLNYEQKQRMYTNARETAENCFDYRLYCNHIKRLLEE